MLPRTSAILVIIFFLMLSTVGCYQFTTPSIATSNYENVGTDRVGTAECQEILGVYAWGDCSIQAAMKNGKITKIHHVDHYWQIYVFGVYAVLTTQVYGR